MNEQAKTTTTARVTMTACSADISRSSTTLVSPLTGGPNEATEGTLNVGQTTFSANVIYGGSEPENKYDWSVTFTVKDENGQSVLPGGLESMSANECLDGSEDEYSHAPLSQIADGTTRRNCCIDVMLSWSIHCDCNC